MARYTEGVLHRVVVMRILFFLVGLLAACSGSTGPSAKPLTAVADPSMLIINDLPPSSGLASFYPTDTIIVIWADQSGVAETTRVAPGTQGCARFLPSLATDSVQYHYAIGAFPADTINGVPTDTLRRW